MITKMMKCIKAVWGFFCARFLEIWFVVNIVLTVLNHLCERWKLSLVDTVLGITGKQFLLASLGVTVLLWCMKYLIKKLPDVVDGKLASHFKDIGTQATSNYGQIGEKLDAATKAMEDGFKENQKNLGEKFDVAQKVVEDGFGTQLEKLEDQFLTLDFKRNAHATREFLLQCGLIKDAVYHPHPNPENGHAASIDLLGLVASYMHYSHVRVDRKIDTDYYVYTLAASHQEADLGKMEYYMCEVVRKIVDKYHYWGPTSKDQCHVPVLIVPQNRNVLLAEAVSNQLSSERHISALPIMTYQKDVGDDDHTDKEPYDLFYRTFIGCEMLQRTIHELFRKYRDVTVHGIFIDCNVTRGSVWNEIINRNWSINSSRNPGFPKFMKNKELLDKFKEGFPDNKVSFAPIQDCATLFVASDQAIYKKKSDDNQFLQDNLKAAGIRLWYYFVLPECVKEALYDGCDKKEILESSLKETSDANNRRRKEKKRPEEPFDEAIQSELSKVTGIQNGWINTTADTVAGLIQCLDPQNPPPQNQNPIPQKPTPPLPRKKGRRS